MDERPAWLRFAWKPDRSLSFPRFAGTLCRRAANGAAFVERVARVTGLRLEILGQEEEARLAMLGCLPLVDADVEQVLMVDIGGGSTEIMWLDRFAACPWDVPGLEEALFGWSDGEGIKRGQAQAPVRVAVTGRTVGPPLLESLEVLGRERTLDRLRAARARL